MTEPVDLEAGKLRVKNEYFFRDLSNYRLKWTALDEYGYELASGNIDNLNVQPQQTAEIHVLKCGLSAERSRATHG